MDYILAVILVLAVSWFVFSPAVYRKAKSKQELAEAALAKKIESLKDDVLLSDEQRKELELELASSAAKEINVTES